MTIDERTLAILKPDAVQRGLMGAILSRIEQKGLRILGMRMLQPKRETVAEHYQEHAGKDFMEGLVGFLTSGRVVVLCVAGPRAIGVMRKLIGATFGHAAHPGTIRGDFAGGSGYNLIHSSDSAASAEREIQLWFSEGEICDEPQALGQWIWDPRDAGATTPTD